MKFIQPSPEVAPYGLRAMTMVASAATEGLGSNQRVLLAAAQHVILHTALDIDSLAPITPEELSSHMTDADLRRQFIQGMTVMSIVDGPATPEQSALITAFAQALGVDEPAVKVIHDLADKETLLFRLDFYRRSHVLGYIKKTIQTAYRTRGGLIGAAKAMLGPMGLAEDPPLAARFHALGELPQDTLGYAFYRHYIDHGFGFPGEKNGFPLGAVYHDFAHVLSGNPPDPEGEILVGAFQAGFRRNENAFFIILFVVLIHSTVADMMVHPKDPVLRGRLAQGDVAERMLKELKRGSAMNTDLADWDFWSYVGLPLEQVREQLAIPPQE